MWRVHLNGGVSDMANLTWAKKGAAYLVLRDLNCPVQETAAEGSLTATEALPVVEESPDTPAAIPDATGVVCAAAE
jgi:hypothetical protein